MEGDALNLVESTHKTETEGHKCSVCGGPDHRACGCEAKQQQKEVARQEVNKTASAFLDQDKYNKQDAADILNAMLESRAAAVAAQQDVVEELKKLNEHISAIRADIKLAVESFNKSAMSFAEMFSPSKSKKPSDNLN